jgi:uncharacterized membrane protein
MPATDRYRPLAVACVGALAVLALAWELWLAPLRPGGSLLALKAVPLALAVPALWRGGLRAYQWWSMLILLYLCEGTVRAMSDPSTAGRVLGGLEALLSVLAYGAILAHVRAARRASAPAAARP